MQEKDLPIIGNNTVIIIMRLRTVLPLTNTLSFGWRVMTAFHVVTIAFVSKSHAFVAHTHAHGCQQDGQNSGFHSAKRTQNNCFISIINFSTLLHVFLPKTINPCAAAKTVLPNVVHLHNGIVAAHSSLGPIFLQIILTIVCCFSFHCCRHHNKLSQPKQIHRCTLFCNVRPIFRSRVPTRSTAHSVGLIYKLFSRGN